MITPEEWIKELNERYPKFRWFVPNEIKEPLALAMFTKNYGNALSLLSQLWYILPDNEFNIIENPPGWSDLLFLIDNPPLKK